MSKDIESQKEQGFVDAFTDVDRASIPFDTNNPYQMPSAKEWDDLTGRRKKYVGDNRTRRSERELDIERKLKTPVSANFQDMPLSDVLHQLARLAAINLHLDPKGLTEEGVSPDTPVTLNLDQEVSLKSALRLILEPLRLSYVIKDEVLKVTSEQLRDNEVYTVLYSVADLVIPIPNFVPGSNMGLAGALHDAQASLGAGGFMNAGLGGGAPTAVLASRDGSPASGMINPASAGPDGHGWHGRRHGSPGRTAAERAVRAGWHGRRPAGRFRFADGVDHLDHSTHVVGRSGRPRFDRRVRHQLEPGHQPDAGSPRADRRLAGTAAPPAGFASHDRSAVHHAQRQLLRADRRRLAVRSSHRRQRQRSHRVDHQSADHVGGGRFEPAGGRCAVPELYLRRWTFRSISRASAWPRRSSANRCKWPRSGLPSSATSRPTSWSMPARATAARTCCRPPR